MGKVIFWIVVVFAALFVLRLLNVAKAKAKRRAREGQTGANAYTSGNEPMVRCVRCGVYLPRGEAKALPSGFSCGDAKCLQSH